MNVSERVNVATINVDFSDDKSVFDAVMFILSNSKGGNAYDKNGINSGGLAVLTTKVRMIKILFDYAKHLKSDEIGFNEKTRGTLGDAKGFIESKMNFILNGNSF